jgi:hypothetical protein
MAGNALKKMKLSFPQNTIPKTGKKVLKYAATETKTNE